MFRTYYYNQQLKKAIIAFCNVFAGLCVKTGLDGCGEVTTLEVPIRYGSTDRVVAFLGSSNTQNKLFTLPMMAAYMTSINLAPGRVHGVNQVDKRTYLEQGGIYPDDVKAIRRVMPIPYDLSMELSIYASNTDQMFQILEQVLLLFDYDLQLQVNDAPWDWAKMVKLTLESISNEEAYPSGTERRVLVQTLSFTYGFQLSPPIEVRDEIVRSIKVRLGDIDCFHMDEINEEGNLEPFNEIWTEFVVRGSDAVEPVDPTGIQPAEQEHYDPSLESCALETDKKGPPPLAPENEC